MPSLYKGGNMQDISKGILEVIEEAKPKLLQISSAEASFKKNPRSWSKEEIIGHLIDSASNNHQRFVRAAQNIASDFPPYNQDRWVEIEAYNKMEWSKLIELFFHYNWMLANVISLLPEEVLTNPCGIGKDEPVTLEFVIKDYLRHLKHHINKILE